MTSPIDTPKKIHVMYQEVFYIGKAKRGYCRCGQSLRGYKLKFGQLLGETETIYVT